MPSALAEARIAGRAPTWKRPPNMKATTETNITFGRSRPLSVQYHLPQNNPRFALR